MFALAVLLLHLSSSETLALSTSHPILPNLPKPAANGNFRKLDLLHQGNPPSKLHGARPTTSYDLSVEVENLKGQYLVNLAIGTPPVTFLAIPHTAGDLTWTQCEPCIQCFDQPIPIYDPSKSSSFSSLPCGSSLCHAAQQFNCSPNCTYKNDFVRNSTQGVMGTETFTFGDASVPGIVFGCGNSNTFFVAEGSGMIGLGRGALSLPSQLNVNKFSYCFPPLGESNGRLFFGSQADLKAHSNSIIQFTPLLRNSYIPVLYYVSLKGITVGETRLPIPSKVFKVKSNGSGGTVLNSGSLYGALEPTAFKFVKEEFSSQLNSELVEKPSLGFDACFSVSTDRVPKVPKLIYHFEGADFDLPVENYMLYDSAEGLLCLMIFESTYLGVSIFSGIQQQNFHILYDLEKEVLSFTPAECSRL